MARAQGGSAVVWALTTWRSGVVTKHSPQVWGSGVRRFGVQGPFSPKPAANADALCSYLRKRVLKLVFLSQVLYKFVNLFFTLRIS